MARTRRAQPDVAATASPPPIFIRRIPQAKLARAKGLAPIEHKGPFLRPLYEVLKVLSRFASVNEMLAKLLAVVSQPVPLRTAILIEDRDGFRQMRAWHAQGVGRERLERAERNAKVTHAYLAHVTSSGDDERERDSHRWDRHPADDGAEEGQGFITLPMVGEQGQIFGVFQVEGRGSLDENALAFISAVSEQLAAALDRYYAFRHEVELRRRAETLEQVEKHLRLRERSARLTAEQAKRRLAFLAEASALLSASFDARSTLTAVARLAMKRLAEGCAIELVDTEPRDAGHARILEVRPGVSVDAARALVEQVAPRVLASGDVVKERPAGDRGAGVLGVPLRARGRTIGVLTLVSTRAKAALAPEAIDEAQDLARRLAMAVDNARLYREAQEAIASRENLLAVVSHDLKTPLCSIAMCAELLLGGTPKVERRRRGRKQLEGILRSAERMKHLVRDLLDVASIEAGHLTLHRMQHDVEPLLTETHEVLQPIAGAKSVTLEVEAEDGLPQVGIDRERVLQVLSNLVGNAIKFTPEHGLVRAVAARDDSQVRFSVSDTGPGIDESHLPHVFAQYWQAKDTAHLGNGLGLFICKGIIEAHGGRIWVESTVGNGSVFHFTAPAVPGSVVHSGQRR